jgi:MFS family permease
MAEEKRKGLMELGVRGLLKLDEPPNYSLDELTKERAPEIRKFSPTHTILTASLYLVLYLPALNQTAISTALSKILCEINPNSSDAGYTWVGSSYALAQAMSLPMFGQFGHTPSRRWAFIAAMSIFMIGSSVCEAAVNIEMLLTARIIQGIGAGGISGLSIKLLDDLVRVRCVFPSCKSCS